MKNERPGRGFLFHSAFSILHSAFKRWAGATLLLISLISPIASPLHAAESKGAGSSLFPFLKIPVSARVTALGGALGADDGDAAGIDTNMAGLAGLRRPDIQVSYISHFEESSLQAVSFGFPIAWGKKTPALEHMEGAEFPQRQVTLGLEYRSFKAEDDGYSETDNPLGTFDVKDQLLLAGLAFPIGRRLSLGAAAKSISGKIEEKTTSVSAFDGAMIFKFNSRWNVGLSAQNMGSGKKYTGTLGTGEYALPLTYRGGVAYRMSHKLLLIADLAQSKDDVTRKSGGFEWAPNRVIRFRGGAFHHTSFEFSGGLGLDIKGPQKYYQPPARAQTYQTRKTDALSPMAIQILGRLADKLIESYIAAKTDPGQPTLAVLPLDAQEKAASQKMDAVLANEFVKSNEFTMEDGGGAAYIVSGRLELIDGKYTVNSRIIRMEDGETIGLALAEIAAEDLYETGKLTLGDPTAAVSPKEDASDSRVNIGLDYGAATNKELGLTHTMTLKILY